MMPEAPVMRTFCMVSPLSLRAKRSNLPRRRLLRFARNDKGETMQKVLITGASGIIGTRLRRLLKGVYPHLRLSDLKTPADLAADEEFVAADLADLTAVERAADGVD